MDIKHWSNTTTTTNRTLIQILNHDSLRLQANCLKMLLLHAADAIVTNAVESMRRLKPADKPPMGTNCFIDNFFSFIFCGRMFCLFLLLFAFARVFVFQRIAFFSVSFFFTWIFEKLVCTVGCYDGSATRYYSACYLSPFRHTFVCVYISHAHWLIHSLLFVATLLITDFIVQ